MLEEGGIVQVKKKIDLFMLVALDSLIFPVEN